MLFCLQTLKTRLIKLIQTLLVSGEGKKKEKEMGNEKKESEERFSFVEGKVGERIYYGGKEMRKNLNALTLQCPYTD